MLRFLDGPAGEASDTGLALNLEQAPEYLRVVLKTDGTWDALDQPEDQAQDNDVIHAYRREGGVGQQFIETGSGLGQRLLTGIYRYVTNQPDDATMRDNAAWNTWIAGQ